EIWEQTDGTLSALIAGMGTGGTISGCGRFLKEQDPAVRVIGVDPDGSLYHDYIKYGRVGEARTYRIEGIGEDFFPSTMDFSVVWDDAWMQAAGFLDGAGRVADLLDRADEPRPVVLACLGEPISEVLRRMKQHALEELPVVEGTRVVGIVHELDLVGQMLQGH